jgi:hypothetical protein
MIVTIIFTLVQITFSPVDGGDDGREMHSANRGSGRDDGRRCGHGGIEIFRSDGQLLMTNVHFNFLTRSVAFENDWRWIKCRIHGDRVRVRHIVAVAGRVVFRGVWRPNETRAAVSRVEAVFLLLLSFSLRLFCVICSCSNCLPHSVWNLLPSAASNLGVKFRRF